MSIAYVIHETDNYGQFSRECRNRPLVEKHVIELMDSIRCKNLLSSYPIVVDPSLNVLDGQHRLEAARRLGVPIFFIVEGAMSIDDVGRVNSAQRGWTKENNLEFYASGGNQNYLALKAFLSQYPWMSLTAASEVCYYGDRVRRGDVFDNGQYVANDIEFAHKVAKAALDFKPYVKWYRETTFILTMRNLLSNAAYDHARMVRKLRRCSTKLRKGTDIASYISMLNDIYNYGEGEDNKVFLRKISSGSKGFRLDRNTTGNTM
jgi:hypothetical protein